MVRVLCGVLLFTTSASDFERNNTAQGLIDEGEELASRDFVLFSVSGMAMILVAVAFTFSVRQPVHCRGMVTYAGAMPIYFALFAGIGLCGLAGIPFNALMAAAPILFLGACSP